MKEKLSEVSELASDLRAEAKYIWHHLRAKPVLLDAPAMCIDQDGNGRVIPAGSEVWVHEARR